VQSSADKAEPRVRRGTSPLPGLILLVASRLIASRLIASRLIASRAQARRG
jgi:hypothetical protein